MAELKITYTKSAINATKKQIANIEALGLKKLNSTVTKKDSPQLRGIINKVSHLVKVEEI